MDLSVNLQVYRQQS